MTNGSNGVQGGDNGRASLAIITTKLDALSQRLDEILEIVKADHDSVVRLCEWRGEAQKQIGDLAEKIEEVNRARKWESRIEAILVFLGSLITMQIDKGP